MRRLAVRHTLSISMWFIINSMEESMPEPGVGTNLTAAESEFIVVLFLLPGEVVVDKELGTALVLSAVLNWLANTCAKEVDDSIDQWESRAEIRLTIGQLNKGFSSSLVGLSMSETKPNVIKCYDFVGVVLVPFVSYHSQQSCEGFTILVGFQLGQHG